MKIVNRVLAIYLVLMGLSACGDHQFSQVEKGQAVDPIDPPEKGPSVLVLEAPKGDLSIFDDLSVEYQVVVGSSPIASVECSWNGLSIPCGKEKDRVKLPGGKVGGHQFQIIARDINGLEDRKTLPWRLFDKFKKHKTPFQILGKNDLVDILFVIDNSDSMQEEQTYIAQRFHSLVDQFKTMNWQIAMVTTTPSHSVYGDGRFVKFPNNDYMISSKLDLATARDLFAKTVQRDESGSNTEEGIRATARSIQRYATPKEAIDQYHRKFFRDGASLSVVVVSDEDESDFQPINQEKELLKLVDKTWQGNKKFQFHSIIARPGDQACLKANGHTQGYHYAELTKMTHGILGDICALDYGSQLAAIGQSVANTQKTYDLDCVPKDLDNNGVPDVLVTEASSGSVPSFNVTGSQIIFTQAPGIGDYSIEYYCASK